MNAGLLIEYPRPFDSPESAMEKGNEIVPLCNGCKIVNCNPEHLVFSSGGKFYTGTKGTEAGSSECPAVTSDPGLNPSTRFHYRPVFRWNPRAQNWIPENEFETLSRR